METLLNTVFIQTLLDPCMQGRCASELESLYKDFLKTFVAVCDTIPDYKSLSRILTLTLIHVRHPIENRSSAKYRFREHFLVVVAKLLDAELQLLEKRLQYPECFATRSDASPRSVLHWLATPTELAELLCALDFSDAIGSADGRKATFTDIVEAFEQLFDIRLGNPHDLKRNVLRRKTRLTVFLDKLRRLLSEYSSRF